MKEKVILESLEFAKETYKELDENKQSTVDSTILGAVSFPILYATCEALVTGVVLVEAAPIVLCCAVGGLVGYLINSHYKRINN